MAQTKYADHIAQAKVRKPGTLDRETYLQRAREFCKRGFDLPQTKIPPLAVVAIRKAARDREEMRRKITEEMSNTALAKKWGVHQRTIEKILRYETAAHIP